MQFRGSEIWDAGYGDAFFDSDNFSAHYQFYNGDDSQVVADVGDLPREVLLRLDVYPTAIEIIGSGELFCVTALDSIGQHWLIRIQFKVEDGTLSEGDRFPLPENVQFITDLFAMSRLDVADQRLLLLDGPGGQLWWFDTVNRQFSQFVALRAKWSGDWANMKSVVASAFPQPSHRAYTLRTVLPVECLLSGEEAILTLTDVGNDGTIDEVQVLTGEESPTGSQSTSAFRVHAIRRLRSATLKRSFFSSCDSLATLVSVSSR